jgi:methyl-accepting chemotaxis protein
MKLRTRISLGLIAASALTAVVILAGVVTTINDIVSRANERELRSHYSAMISRLDQEAQRAAAMSAVVSVLPSAQEAFARGDRAALLKQFEPGFALLKSQYGVDQFQFHTVPATSFVRVHQPGKFGDDLSSFRKTVVMANNGRRPIVGLESGVAGLGIRGVVPVRSADQHLGTVEIGLSFGQEFFEKFRSDRAVDVSLHLKKGEGFNPPIGTLGNHSMFSAPELLAAASGGFVIRQASAASKPVALLLGPVKDFSGAPIGAVEIAMDNSEYVSATARAYAVAAAIGCLALVAAAVAGLWIAAGISRPIQSICSAMNDLARGNLAIAVPKRNGRDEVAEMADAVEVFRRNMVEAERLRTEQATLRKQQAEQRRAELQQLAAEFEAAVGDIVETVSSASTELEASAGTLMTTADHTARGADAVARASEEASTNVQSVASASEQMTSSVNEIGRRVEEASRIAAEAVAQAETTNAHVTELSRAADQIEGVVDLINKIASQTNLLALNATIEAARAGDAGRGFAVVAAEVKALAGQTATATGHITQYVSGILRATGDSVQSIELIGTTIDRLSEISSAIAAAVEQQGVATNEISRNVHHAAEGTRQVTQNISDVQRRADETDSASAHVLAAARSLSDDSNRLKSEVARFLGSVRSA